jgi:hypothetical protein
MEIYFDESGTFRPLRSNANQVAVVMGVLIPELESDSLRKDFEAFLRQLPPRAFVNKEIKGHRLSAEQFKLLAIMLNVHPGIRIAPVTVNVGFMRGASFEAWPQKLRALLEEEGAKCLYDKMRSEVGELARRSGNLSPDQLIKIFAYAIAVKRSIEAIPLFYHCQKYHSEYSPLQFVFDRAGASNSREELVFKEVVFMWLVPMSKRKPSVIIRQIHTHSHPFMQLYGAETDGQQGFDLSKMLRGNLHFDNSRSSWQLQLSDCLAAAWLNVLRDHDNSRGYLPIFRLLNRNSVLPNDQPVGMVSMSEAFSEMTAPPQFEVFRRMTEGDGKLLPCGWDEK